MSAPAIRSGRIPILGPVPTRGFFFDDVTRELKVRRKLTYVVTIARLRAAE